MLFVTPQWGIKHIKHLNARAGNMPNTSIASLGDAVKHTNKGIYYIYIFSKEFKNSVKEPYTWPNGTWFKALQRPICVPQPHKDAEGMRFCIESK